MNHTILQMLRDAQPSVFQKVASYTLPEDIPHGDMPGDKILRAKDASSACVVDPVSENPRRHHY